MRSAVSHQFERGSRWLLSLSGSILPRTAHDHAVRLMAPKFIVAPYRLSGKRGKNDAADAAAICEPTAPAIGRPISQLRRPTLAEVTTVIGYHAANRLACSTS
jgi:hypothetical protein